jgi:hypothetical protein
MDRKPEKVGVITPAPHLELNFKCSNRAFLDVKDTLYRLWDETDGLIPDDELYNGHLSEKCDYEGDLERIILYTTKDIEPFIKKVCEFYGADFKLVEDCIMNIHLVC